MPKHESEKKWQKVHKEKVKQYQQSYLEGKTEVSVILESWVIEQIAKAKPTEQGYGGWVKELVESWARQQRDAAGS